MKLDDIIAIIAPRFALRRLKARRALQRTSMKQVQHSVRGTDWIEDWRSDRTVRVASDQRDARLHARAERWLKSVR